MDFRRKIALDIAKSLLWTPYKWGGDDPSGLDCSGMMVEILKSVGVLPYYGDWTAKMLFEKFHASTQTPVPGDLIFWWSTAGKIVHVEMIFDSGLSIGAAGGGSSTLDEEDAWEHNAYIRIRPYEGRGRRIAGFKNPYGD